MAGAGHQVGAAQGGRHQTPPESEGPQEGLAVPGAGGRNKVGMASAQSYWGRWQPFYSGSSTHFSLKWIGTSSLWMTSCGCFEARGQQTWRWRCWQHSWPWAPRLAGRRHIWRRLTWLGFVVHPNIPQVLMAANKHILVMEVLQTMVEGQAMHSKDIEKALNRIQWATAACPLAKSMLQPLWAWKMATTTVGKPPKVVRMLAFMLRFLFNTPFVQYSPHLPKSSWRGCSDASASDEGLAFVGGWWCNKVEPEKKEVYWFHEQIHVEEYPWAFKNGDPKRRIAALKMLFLCNMILTHQGPLSSRVRLPVGSPWIQEALHGGDPDGAGLPAPHPWLLAGGQPRAPGIQPMG